MIFIIIGMFTFLYSCAAFLAAFFCGIGAGLTATQVGIVMLHALFGMWQGAFIVNYGGR